VFNFRGEHERNSEIAGHSTPVQITYVPSLVAGLMLSACVLLLLRMMGHAPFTLVEAIAIIAASVVSGYIGFFACQNIGHLQLGAFSSLQSNETSVHGLLPAPPCARTSPMVVTTNDGVVQMANDEACHLLALGRRELIGASLSSFTLEADRANESDAIAALFERRADHTQFAKSVVDARGSEHRVAVSASAIKSPDGNLQGIAHVLVPAQETDQRPVVITTLVHESGIWNWNVETNHIYCSPEWLRMLGYERYEAPTHFDGWMTLIHADDRAAIVGHISRWLNGMSPTIDVDFRILHKADHYVGLKLRGSAVRGADGKIVRVIGTHAELAVERVDAGKLLGRTDIDDYLRLVANALPGALVTYRQEKDGSSTLMYSSPNFADVYGYGPTERDGTSPQQFRFAHKDDVAELLRSVTAAAATLTPWRAEYRVHHPLKGTIWIEESSAPQPQADGSTLWHGFIQDISDRKQSESALKLSEDRLQHAISVAQLGLFDNDLEARKLYTSDRFREIGDWLPDERITLDSLMARVHPDDRELTARNLAEIYEPEGRGCAEFEHRIITRNGQTRWNSVCAQTYFKGEGDLRKAVRVVGAISDVTARKVAEEEATRWQRLFEGAKFGLAYADARTNRIIAVNKAFADDHGYTIEELIDKPLMFFYPLDVKRSAARNVATVDRVGEYVFETIHLRKDGSRYPVLMEVTALKSPTGEVVSRIACCHNLTRMKEVQSALNSSQLLLQSTVASLSEGVLVFEKDGTLRSSNAAAALMLDLPERCDGASCVDLIAAKLFSENHKPISADVMLSNATSTDAEHSEPLVAGTSQADGTTRWMLINAQLIRSNDCEPDGSVVVSFTDITNLRRALDSEAKLASSLKDIEREAAKHQLQLKSVFDRAPDGIFIVDMNRRFTTVNSSFARIFGMNHGDIIGQSTRLMYHLESDWISVGGLLRRSHDPNQPFTGTYTCQRVTGELFPGRISGAALRDDADNVIGYIGIIRDVTIEQARDKALAEAKRLESLGQLTGGIAHDFNNLLTIISTNVQIVARGAAAEDNKRELEAVQQAISVGARLNQRLMTFAQQRHLLPSATNLNDSIVPLVNLMCKDFGETRRIDVIMDLQPDLWMVNIDRSELENAILNLSLNGRDAMPNGGIIQISTSNVAANTTTDPNIMAALPIDHVLLTVSDNGTGMSAETLARAVEPFFTTKETGTGLGLATVYGFVNQSRGKMKITSDVGKGTTIRIYLPAMP
jgi:PAS domain S-box-containing protein